jgi:hypothetical protein
MPLRANIPNTRHREIKLHKCDCGRFYQIVVAAWPPDDPTVPRIHRLEIRNWNDDGDITCIVCGCGGLAETEADREPPLPYTTALCQRCGARWRLEAVFASDEAECVEVTR